MTLALTAPVNAAPGKTSRHRSDVVDSVSGLDMLLSDAALGPTRRMVPPVGVALRTTKALARQPRTVARRGGALVTELAKIGLRRSAVQPAKGDKRFAEPAWTGNPLLNGVLQGYLATTETAKSLVAEVELDWADLERVKFIVSNLCDALAPSNNPVLNPLTWKALMDTGGRSALRGGRHLVSDMMHAPRVPSMVSPKAFKVGKDLATSPGFVVFRTPVFELIQYLPTTEKVHALPLLMIPPTINKYYVADLAPGRSIVEALLHSGQQVFMMSWRNPGANQADWDLDTYGQAVIDALGAVERIAGTPKTSVMAFCSGGIITSMVLAHLAAIGQGDRIATAAFAVTVLDQERAGTTSALLDPSSAQEAVKASKKKGYLDGAQLAEVFAWLRPNDLIWSYWVNNYLQGKTPAAFDILAWNADTTRMPAGLHSDFIELSISNALTKSGTATMLGSLVNLSAVKADSYVVAGIADHLCAWESCYQTTQLLGGKSRFILSTSGHIASLINPPGNPKATWRTAAENPADAHQWLAESELNKGSWWPDFTAWLAERSGEDIDAPTTIGGEEGLLAPAPGTYVFDK
ncbi:MAG: phaA [Frankiales bacterium]|nr:phaA [Frankiales bacterium]